MIEVIGYVCSMSQYYIILKLLQSQSETTVLQNRIMRTGGFLRLHLVWK